MSGKILKMVITTLVLIHVGLFVASFLLSRQSESRHPAIGQQLKIEHINDAKAHTGYMHIRGPETRTAAQEQKERPTIVLIHGASTSLLDFEPSLYPLLEGELDVYSVDRPGYGYSDRFNETLNPEAQDFDESWMNPKRQAQLIIDALEAAGVDNAIWAGHSLGAAIVLAAMLDFPEKVEAGVLIGGGSHPWTGPPVWHMALSIRPILGRLFTWHYVETLGRLMLPKALEVVFKPEQAPPDYQTDTGITLTLRPDTYRHNATDRTSLSRYLETQSTRYNDLTQPMLSIAATDDHVVPAWNHHDRLVKQVDHLETLLLQGAGHAMHHTRSEEVANAIISFARKTSSD